MKLSDQEQVILKVIGSDVAEISRVIKAVGYPKATVKKILAGLNEKGVIALHRHDWPQSLAPADRKLMVKIGRDYFNAVSMRKRNPKKATGKGKTALKKTGRALKGFARGALGAASQILGAGAEALNPVRRKVRNKYIDLVIKGQAKKTPQGWLIAGKKTGARSRGKTFTQGRGTVQVSSGVFLDKSTGLVYAKRERNTAKKTKKKASKRNASRAIHSRPSKSHGAGASRKTANRSGLRSVAKARKVATKRASGKALKKSSSVMGKSNPRRGSRKKLGAARRAVSSGKFTYADWSTPLLRAQRKDTANHLKWLGDKEPRAATIVRTRLEQIDAELARRGLKKGKRNPSAESIRKEFAGSVSGERDLFFPQGTPAGKLAKLGKLVSITTEEGTIKPVSGTAWLCADTKERLHIGSTTNAPLYSGPARSFGKVSKVEYESSKPHLGYKGPIIWFHHMGEKGGTKPTLHADGKGGLKFRGGRYTLTTRGIEH